MSSLPGAGLWSAVLPALACAVCPACLATYAKLLSVLGLGFELNEFQHLVLLAMGIGASIGVSAWRSWRTRRAWPIAIAFVGSTLVAIGHFAGEVPVIEWAGIFMLMAGGFIEHFRLRRSRGSPAPSAA